MPLRELARLQTVHRFLKLDINQKEELQELVHLAAEICGTPTALITFLDDSTQFIKFKIGFEANTTSREVSFCSHLMQGETAMVIPDALLDSRFKNNPLVVQDPSIRFYAGSALTTHDGVRLGSLCVIDNTPRELSFRQIEMLQKLSRQVIHILEFEMSLQILKQQFIDVKNSEIKLRSFFESSRVCHLLIGKELEVLDFNKALKNFMQQMYNVDVYRGMKVIELINEAYVDDFVKNCHHVLEGSSIQQEKHLAYKNAGGIWWKISYEPARDEHGDIIGISYNGENIDDRKQYEERILCQNESLKQIARVQSHEIRRPLSSILGIVELMKEHAQPGYEEYIKLLDQASSELDQKVRQIVDQANT